jgi:hypothetical protein
VLLIKQAELGISGEEVCRRVGISDATFDVLRKKYGGVAIAIALTLPFTTDSAAALLASMTARHDTCSTVIPAPNASRRYRRSVARDPPSL